MTGTAEMDVMAYASLGLVLLAIIGVILLAYLRRRHPAKAESEKRIGQARRRRFIDVAQEKRLGLPRRNRDCPPDGMGTIVTDEVDPLADLARATQSDVELEEKRIEVEKKKCKLRKAK